MDGLEIMMYGMLLHYFTATPPAVVVVQLRDLQLHTGRHITTSTIQCTLTVYIPIQHLNCYLFPSYRNAPAHVQLEVNA